MLNGETCGTDCEVILESSWVYAQVAYGFFESLVSISAGSVA